MQNPGDGDLAGDAFWRFSLALYARPGVAHALIALQDRAARDVNLILYALWLGIRGLRLVTDEFASVEALITPLNAAAAAPLRHLRQELKGSADRDLATLRRRIAALELEAERRVQYRLAARLRTGVFDAIDRGDRLEVAKANVALYLGSDSHSPEAGTICRALASLTRRT